MVSVCECEHSPLLCNKLSDDLKMSGFVKEENRRRRQDLERYYRLNGGIYISKVSVFGQLRSFYGDKSYAYIMGQKESIDIDTELDFDYAELLLKKQRS